MQMFLGILCTEICLLTGKYESVIALDSCNESDVCKEPDFAIISTEDRKYVFIWESCLRILLLSGSNAFSFDTPL